MNIEFSRAWAMPNADTFDCAPIGAWVKQHLAGVSVDPFARNKRWATYTNDLDMATDAEFHMDAEAFLEMLAVRGVVADCIVLDPPYSPRQVKDCYTQIGLQVGKSETQTSALYRRVRTAARKLCKPGTTVLSFGWNSTGMGKGFEKREIFLVCHGGAHNDTICLREVME